MLLPIPEEVIAAQARERLSDTLVASLGLAAAAGSVAFAAYMIATSPGAGGGSPRAVLAAGPAIVHAPPRTLSGPLGPGDAAPGSADDPELDFTPVGSIPGARAPHRAAAAAPLSDFAVRDVFDDTALVEAQGTLQLVRPGSAITGAGVVLSIAREGGGWVVRTDNGTITQRRDAPRR